MAGRSGPLRNRVDPWGEIVAVSARGTLMGNRGILHDDHRQIVKPWRHRNWVACRLWPPRRGNEARVPMTPGSYTELFFLDEATALSGGHRPCAGCRKEDADRFCAAWRSTIGPARPVQEYVDKRLHADRLTERRTKRTFRAAIGGLPDGVMVVVDAKPALVWQDRLLRWDWHGYEDLEPRPSSLEVEVLTPSCLVDVIAAGYTPAVHDSASAGR